MCKLIALKNVKVDRKVLKSHLSQAMRQMPYCNFQTTKDKTIIILTYISPFFSANFLLLCIHTCVQWCT